MSRVREILKQTAVGIAKDVPWMIEQNRYQRTREPRIRAANQEAEQLIHSLFPAAAKPGSPEAKSLVSIGANVTSYVVSEICDPDTQIYLNGILEPVQNWATDSGNLEAVHQARRSFLRSGLYSDYFNIIRDPNPNTIEETRRMGQAVEFVDQILFGTVTLDNKGKTELDIADKRGTAEFEYETFITGAADHGIFSIAQMSASWHKMGLNMEYNGQSSIIARIAIRMGAIAIGKFYGADPAWSEDNPLFQERINEIIKQTLNPQPQR